MSHKIKRYFVLLMGAVRALSLFSGCGREKAELSPGLNLYVSQNGSDMADGSFEHPFQSLVRAQLEVRALKAQWDEPITVNIRGGEYYFDESLRFDEKDSGTEGAPITWQSYNGEKVLLSGGISLPAEKFMP